MQFHDNMRVAPSATSDIMERYRELSILRDPLLHPGRDYSRMTLPWVLPETGTRASGDDQHGWQSYGAKLVNHLANKIVNTLFPPNSSHFKAELKPEQVVLLEKKGINEKTRTMLLSGIEDNAKKEAESLSATVARILAAKHLIICGNVCLYTPPKGQKQSVGFKSKMQVVPFNRYVVRRDLHGNLLEYIQEAKQFMRDYSPALQMKILAGRNSKGKQAKKAAKAAQAEEVTLYTRALYNSATGLYEITQSADTVPIGEMQTVATHKLPWNVLVWNKREGSPYGGGLVEDYSGDFQKLEFLEAALAKGLILMADIKYLIKHGSTLDIDEFIDSDMGAVLQGSEDDIAVIQLEKYLDFTPIREVINETQRNLGQAFLMNSANRRDAERVTTYELRLDATELEVSLGGIYSLLAEEWLKTDAVLLISRLSNVLTEEHIEPVIRTGLAALGKLDDLDKMYQFTEMMQMPATWPEGLQAGMKWTMYAELVAGKLSMQTPWLKSQTEMDADQAKAQEQQLQLMAAQGAADAIPGVANEAVKGQQEKK